jgi:integrase
MRMLYDVEGVKPTYSVTRLKEKHIGSFSAFLKYASPSTEQVYLTSAKNFYSFLVADEYANFNMEKVRFIIQSRSRKVHLRAPEFKEEDIRMVLDRIAKIPLSLTPTARLRDLRDIALILVLSDTGLRIGEAFSLKRGDIDAKNGTIYVIGKGGKEAIVILNKRSARALGQYLRARQELDGAQGVPLNDLPVFSRHDKATGQKIRRMTTVSGRDIVHRRACQVLDKDSHITPHQFRHYFVTMVYRKTDLKFASEAARHSNLQITGRYAHLDKKDMKARQRRALD